MTPERFAQIVAAYGAAPERWPETERGAAQAHVLAEPQATHAPLAEAAALDGLLAGHADPAPSADLMARVLAGRPAAADWRRWGAGLGAALAAACAAGVVFGVNVSQHVVVDDRTEAVIAATLDDEPTTTAGDSVHTEEQG